jgi:hypothetical protein
MQIREPQVCDEIACGAATASARWENDGIDCLRPDARVFDCRKRSFQRKFESGLFRASAVRCLTNSDNASSVSQMCKVRHRRRLPVQAVAPAALPPLADSWVPSHRDPQVAAKSTLAALEALSTTRKAAAF